MLRYYSFNYQKKEVRCASVLKEMFDNSEITAEELKRFKKEIKDF